MFLNGALYSYAGSGTDWNWKAIDGSYSAVGIQDQTGMEIALRKTALTLTPSAPIKAFVLAIDKVGPDWTTHISDYAPEPGQGGFSLTP